MNAANNDRPELEVSIAVTVETAWRALRDRDTLLQWHGWETGDNGAEVDLIYFTDTVEDDEQHVLIAQGGDRFEVVPDGEGVRVKLTRGPLNGDPEWDAYYDEITEGWISFLQQLRFTLERGKTTGRLSYYLAAKKPFAEIAARSGVADLLALPPGTAYASTLAGEPVHGEVWFRSAQQFGVTVDSWGAGLLIIGGAEAGSMAILSAYDQDEAEFAELTTRWQNLWDAEVSTGGQGKAS